jgi:hypothetical protein
MRGDVLAEHGPYVLRTPVTGEKKDGKNQRLRSLTTEAELSPETLLDRYFTEVCHSAHKLKDSSPHDSNRCGGESQPRVM